LRRNPEAGTIESVHRLRRIPPKVFLNLLNPCLNFLAAKRVGVLEFNPDLIELVTQRQSAHRPADIAEVAVEDARLDLPPIFSGTDQICVFLDRQIGVFGPLELNLGMLVIDVDDSSPVNVVPKDRERLAYGRVNRHTNRDRLIRWRQEFISRDVNSRIERLEDAPGHGEGAAGKPGLTLVRVIL